MRKSPTQWAFHLGDEVRSLAEDYAVAARNKGVRFAVDIPPEAEIRVRGDAARLERVMNCLLSNAVKFTDRGEVRLGVSRLAGDAYRFEVSDTGVGFDDLHPVGRQLHPALRRRRRRPRRRLQDRG